MKKEKERITIYLTHEIFQRLRQYAFKQDLPRTLIVEIAIRELLAKVK